MEADATSTKARLDAANNDVDGIREMVEKLGFTAFPQVGQQPPRDTKGAGEAGHRRTSERHR